MAGSRASPRTHLSFSRCDRSAWTSPEVDGRRPESLATTCGTIGALGCVPALGIIITGLARGSPSWTSPGDKPRNQTSSSVAIFGVCFLAAKGETHVTDSCRISFCGSWRRRVRRSGTGDKTQSCCSKRTSTAALRHAWLINIVQLSFCSFSVTKR